MQTTNLEELSLLHIKEMNKPIIVIDFIGSIFIVFMVYPVTIKTYMDIYVLCLDILYIFLSVVVLKKNMFNRLNINIFMIAGLLVGIVFEVLLNFGQASMSDYFNLKAFLLFIILQVSLINAGNYLLKTF